MRTPSGTRPIHLGEGSRLIAVGLSLLVPGAGHVVMLGQVVRGMVWMVGWLALVILGAGHLLPGLALMAVSALDAWWASRPRDAAQEPDRRGGDTN
jgi:hypothetical protein